MKRIAAALFAISIASTINAQTTFIRQMAKDPSSLYVVVSGPETKRLGDLLLQQVQDHKDWTESKKKKLSVLTLDQATELLKAQPKLRKETFIVLLTREEKPALSDELALALRVDASDLTSTVSRIHAQVVRPVKQGLSFSIVAIAPDKEREARLITELLKYGERKADLLSLDKQYKTNKVAIHLSDGFKHGNWGTIAGAWNAISTSALGDNPPEQDSNPETNLAYLIDRSAPPSGLPESISELAKSLGGEDNLVVAVQKTLPDNRKVVVLSAPNATLLSRLCVRFPDAERIPTVGYKEKVVDLRKVGRSTLVVQRNSLPKEIADVIRGEVASDMRSKKIDVAESIPGGSGLTREVGEDQLAGSTEAVRALHDRAGLRYVWCLSLLDTHGGTAYRGEQRRVSDVPSEWQGGPRPDVPDRRRGDTDAQRAEQVRQWREDCAKWDADHDEWQNRVAVRFEQQIQSTTTASVRISLKLFDLQDDLGKVVWEKELVGTKSETREFKTETVVVHGAQNQPSELRVPESTNECPDSFYSEAGRDGAANALSQLLQEAWLDGNPYGQLPPKEEVPPTQNANVTVPAMTVTSVSAIQAEISIGRVEGVIVGDKVVIETDQGNVNLRVTEVGKRSLCRPISDLDKSRFTRVQKGSVVHWSH